MTYFGDNEKVYDFMQKISHRTRAYLVNANGLKGILTPGIVTALRDSSETGELEAVTKY